MSTKRYRPYQPKQTLLLPLSLDNWLPEDHLARFVSNVVDQLDLSCIYAEYDREKRGYPQSSRFALVYQRSSIASLRSTPAK